MRNPWRKKSYMNDDVGLGLVGCGFMIFGFVFNLALIAGAVFVIAKVACWALPGIPWC